MTPETFEEFVAEHGWGYRRESFPEMVTDGGDIVNGFTALHIFKWISINGLQHVYTMTVSPAIESDPWGWKLAIRTAEAGLAEYLEKVSA